MIDRLTIEYVRQFLDEHHAGCVLLSNIYKNNRTKLDIVCENNHKFSACFDKIKNGGRWCAECAGLKKHTIDYVKKFIENKHPNCAFLSDSYTNTKTKLELICENGHKFSSTFSDVKQGSWCPWCARNRKHTIGYVKDFINIRHPGATVISENYVNMTEDLDFCCEKGHRFSSRFGNIVHNDSWCPECTPDRRKETYFTRTGYENPSQNEQVKEIKKQKSLVKYGCEYVFQNEEIKETIKQKNNINFGCDYPQQNREIALRTAVSQNDVIIKYHWKTGEPLSCKAGYEQKVVDYLNINKIDFTWQPQTFKLSTGITYRPDLYLVNQDLWIEIKGWERPDAMLKWEEFHTKIKPNSELWNKKKLKKLGIIKK